MGSTVSRIEKEFILNSVCDKGIPLRLSGTKARIIGQVASVDEEYIVITSDESLSDCFVAGSEIRAYFSYFEHVMTFDTIVRGFLDNGLKADFPRSIHKNLTRKYERVSPPFNVSISFEIQEAKIELAFPKTEEYNPAEPPEYSEDYDPGDLVAPFLQGARRIEHREMLHRGNDDMLAFFGLGLGQSLDREVIALRAGGRENNLRVRRADQRRHLAAGLLQGVPRRFAAGVQRRRVAEGITDVGQHRLADFG